MISGLLDAPVPVIDIVTVEPLGINALALVQVSEDVFSITMWNIEPELSRWNKMFGFAVADVCKGSCANTPGAFAAMALDIFATNKSPITPR